MELLDPQNLYSLIDEFSIPEIYKLRSLQRFIQQYGVVPTHIFDCGARDLYESIWFSVHYPTAKVHAFECNPDMTPLCQKRSKYFPNIRFTEAAIGLSETPVTFYKIDQEKTKSQDGLPYYIQKDGNPGASSLFKSLDTVYKQVPIEVQSLRLDTYVQKNNIYQIDVLWMDIQGSELNALKSLGHHLHNVKMIHTEMPIGPNTAYDGAPTFEEIDGYLRDFGFKMVGKGQMDMIYYK